MKSPMISSFVVMLVMASFGMAVLIGRASGPGPDESHATARALDVGPQAVVIETGSVEHRLRAMEAQLLELRNKVELLEAARE